jgi:DNA-binding NarL/FixJ family response regulator
MSSNVFELLRTPRWRVLIAHQHNGVRRVLRTLIESVDTAVVEAADGEAAIAVLEFSRFDLLVLELDLPVRDGIAVMQVHRVLLAHERARVYPPAVIFTLPPEVRGNAALTDHLFALEVYGVIDDAPRQEVAGLVQAILLARSAQLSVDKPAVG